MTICPEGEWQYHLDREVLPTVKTVSLKMPDELDSVLSEAARRTGRSKSLLVRMALARYLPRSSRSSRRSFLSRSEDLAGCVAAASDLSTSKRRMRGYGR